MPLCLLLLLLLLPPLLLLLLLLLQGLWNPQLLASRGGAGIVSNDLALGGSSTSSGGPPLTTLLLTGANTVRARVRACVTQKCRAAAGLRGNRHAWHACPGAVHGLRMAWRPLAGRQEHPAAGQLPGGHHGAGV